VTAHSTGPTWPSVSGRPPLIACLDPAGDRYLRACVEVLRTALGDRLVGVYLYSSAVLGDYIPGRSDIDVLAVVDWPLAPSDADTLGDRIRAHPVPFPTKGLDLEVVTRASAASAAVSPPVELKVLTFADLTVTAEDLPQGDPRLVMHFTCCRDHGIALLGPPTAEVFAPVPTPTYLHALGQELELTWMPPHYLVLNACRDWRYLEESVICSKVAGGSWARTRLADPWLVDAALSWQSHGIGPVIDGSQVDRFLAVVARHLSAADAAASAPRPARTVPDSAWTTCASVADGIATLRRRPAEMASPCIESPLVSCVHTAEAGVAATLRAVAAFQGQDYPNRELIIVTRASDADTLRERLPPDPSITVLAVATTVGDAAARDIGCAATTGALIALWEHGTWYAPWCLSYQVAALLRSGHRVSGCTATIVWDPLAGECWAGRADHRIDERLLVGATVCLDRRDWADQPFRARYRPERTPTDPFLLGLPDGAFHAPRDAQFAVLVAPGTYQAAPRPSRYPPGLAQALIAEDTAPTGTAPRDRPAIRPANPAPSRPRPSQSRPSQPATPLVTCIMPTFNRRRFITQAVRNFLRQDYPNTELLIIDDGTEPIADLLAGVPRATYIRLDHRCTIGHKRNIAAEAANGAVIIQWDDDDWYGPHRITRQVTDIVNGPFDVTGIGVNLLLDARTTQVWCTREREASDPLFVPIEALAGGTLAYRKDLWQQVGGYPDASVGEDMGFLQRLVDAGAHTTGISNQGAYVYIRHGRNSWRFDFEPADGPPGWHRGQPPPTMNAQDLAFYATLGPGTADPTSEMDASESTNT
jgi:hypothetical protein